MARVRDHSPGALAESSRSMWNRRLILMAFWSVVVFLGLPHWIWTTSLHRSNLPFESMNNWADGKACQFRFPIHIRLKDEQASPGNLAILAAEVQGLLNAQDSARLYTFQVVGNDANGTSLRADGTQDYTDDLLFKESALIVEIAADKKVKAFQANLQSLVPILEVRHHPKESAKPAALPTFIASEISKNYADEGKSLSYLLDGSSFVSEQGVRQLSSEERAVLDARTTRAFKYASTYHLTFSLFASSGSPSSWDVEQALQDTIYPLLEKISPVSQFTVDTQVQLWASFSPSIAGPQYNPSSREWQLQRSDLSGFINAAEWPLSPSIGAGPTINFVLYVPSREQSPLVLGETGGNSWIIPQWGGVQILNPTGKQTTILTADDLRPVMLTFADQLSSLVGLPKSPLSLSLRISSLTRERTTSLILSASSTLGALARLTLKLVSIAIPDSVATSVAETIHRLDQACQNLQDGRYQTALENARKAEEEAELAFFEPSMVGQVYFPEEHKVAVYVPLLGPMAVPLVLSALRELKKLRERKTKTA